MRIECALVGAAAVLLLSACSAPEESSAGAAGDGAAAAAVEAARQPELVEILFVQQADRAMLENGVLTLEGVGGSVLYFSDRPNRVVGREPLEQFVDQWDEGEESFERVPPNAVITVVKGDEALDAVFVLSNPVITARDQMTYRVEVLEGPVAGVGEHAALFIDALGVEPGLGGRRGRDGVRRFRAGARGI